MMNHWRPIYHGAALRTARLREGFSQNELAKLIGVRQPTIGNWERGKTKPKKEKIGRLEDALGTFTEEVSDEEESGSSPLGAWINKRRVAKNWTVPELANRASVTSATIYNIEGGRTFNLQKRTIQQIEGALGEKLPRDARKEIAESSNIEGVGELLDFDPYDADNLPKTGGIYVLYDISERPVYVGMAAEIASRIGDHKTRFWFNKPIVETASFVEVPEEGRRREIEKLLIKFLKSNAVINKQNVDR